MNLEIKNYKFMMINQERIDELKANQPINFSEALEMMKFNLKVKRIGWDWSVRIKRPTGINDGSSRDASIIMHNGFELELKVEDILAEDWLIVE